MGNSCKCLAFTDEVFKVLFHFKVVLTVSLLKIRKKSENARNGLPDTPIDGELNGEHFIF